jgi:NADPH:quinone reductase
MKQIQFTKFGAPSVLEIIEKPMPVPNKDEVLIQTEVIGVNYSDILRRKNTYFLPTELPFVPGAEVVGKIIEKSENNSYSHLVIGSRVLAVLPNGGAYSEYVTANGQFCISIPESISSKEASAIFVQGTTAYLIVTELLKDAKGKTILIHSGASGIGSILIQLLKRAGASKIITTCSSDSKKEIVSKLGADIFINSSNANWAIDVVKQNGGSGVDYILEMCGGDIFTQSFTCLKDGGTMIVYGSASGQKGMIHSEHYVDHNHNLISFNLTYYIKNYNQVWQKALGEMISHITKKEILIETGSSFALVDARKAHEEIEARKTMGKVTLVV